MAAITELLARPRPDVADWQTALHDLVDELDALEPAFAAYDRLRFGGPLSRDQLIEDVRRRFPRSGATEPRRAQAGSATTVP